VDMFSAMIFDIKVKLENN